MNLVAAHEDFKPVVSVCIPCSADNSPWKVKGTIDSIACQKYVSYEVVLAGTAENTQSAAGFCAEAQVPYTLSNSQESNFYNLANICLRQARGEYVKFLLPGDRLLPGSLASFLKAAQENPDVVLVSSPVNYLSDQGQSIKRTWSPRYVGNLPGRAILKYFADSFENFIGSLTSTFFKRSAAIDGFDQRYYALADLLLWLKISSRGHFVGLLKPLVEAHYYDSFACENRLRESLLFLADYRRLSHEFEEYSQWLQITEEQWRATVTRKIYSTFQELRQHYGFSVDLVQEAVKIVATDLSAKELTEMLSSMAGLVFDLLNGNHFVAIPEIEQAEVAISPVLAGQIRQLRGELSRLGNSRSWKATEFLRHGKRGFLRTLGKAALADDALLGRLPDDEMPAADDCARLEIRELEEQINKIRLSRSWQVTGVFRKFAGVDLRQGEEASPDLVVDCGNSVSLPLPDKIDLAIFDDIYPCKFSAFRCKEYTSYLEEFSGACVFSSGDSIPLLVPGHNFASTYHSFTIEHPELANRVFDLKKQGLLTAKLGYSVFLSLTHKYLDFYEAQNIPFVFTLYPGGAFYLNDETSDRKLRRVLSSPMFQKVITTQRLVTNYLLDRQFCGSEKILEVIGAVFPDAYEQVNWVDRKRFGSDKDTLDICFVAYKYSKHGIEKGYDVFIKVAHELAKRFGNVQFHVVGGFAKKDYDVHEIADRIRFYGALEVESMAQFYRGMDLILSPNINNQMHAGHFDGFPTGACIEAGMAGVAVFCTDPLGQNSLLRDGEDLVLLEYDVDKIVQKVSAYLREPEKLYAVAHTGHEQFRECYGALAQMTPRRDLLTHYLQNFNNKKS